MKPSSTNSKSAKERFLREAKAAAAIEHDHIVSNYQVGEMAIFPSSPCNISAASRCRHG